VVLRTTLEHLPVDFAAIGAMDTKLRGQGRRRHGWSICIYQAQDADSLREHGRRVGMPGDDAASIATTVVVRDDPK